MELEGEGDRGKEREGERGKERERRREEDGARNGGRGSVGTELELGKECE